MTGADLFRGSQARANDFGPTEPICRICFLESASAFKAVGSAALRLAAAAAGGALWRMGTVAEEQGQPKTEAKEAQSDGDAETEAALRVNLAAGFDWVGCVGSLSGRQSWWMKF